MTIAPELSEHDIRILDNPAWSSLTGAHAHLAEGNDLVRRYPLDVSPFIGVRGWSDPEPWDALISVVGSQQETALSGDSPQVPEGWQLLWEGSGVQLVETPQLQPRAFEEAIVLGEDDVDDMLALVERSRPGPFLPRTYLMGRYLGVRRGGELIAMAGERLQPDGWTEISAVTTDPEYRRQGIASRLVLDLVHDIHARGRRAFMHAAKENANAISAYTALGFAVRRETTFVLARTP